MKIQNSMRLMLRSGLLVAALCLSGCTTAGDRPVTVPMADTRGPLVASVESPRSLLKISSVLVAPISFESGARGQAQGSVGSGPGPQYKKIEHGLESAFSQELDLQLIAWEDRGRGTSTPLRSHANDEPLVPTPTVAKSEVIAEAKRLALGGVLFTELHEYQDRQGSAAGAEVPAAVFFSMELVTPAGELVWKANYRFRDQAISDNLFRLREGLFQSEGGVPVHQGIGFRSGDELLMSGFRSAARELAIARTELFSGSPVPSANVSTSAAPGA